LESVASKTIGGAEKLLEFRKGQVSSFKSAVDETVRNSGGKISREEAGTVIQDAVKTASQVASRKKDSAYDVAYGLIDKESPIKITDLTSANKANEILNNPKYGRLGDISPEVANILKKIAPGKARMVPTKILGPDGKPMVRAVQPAQVVKVGDLIEDSKKLN
jgi:hypothetical protein